MKLEIIKIKHRTHHIGYGVMVRNGNEIYVLTDEINNEEEEGFETSSFDTEEEAIKEGKLFLNKLKNEKKI